MPALPFLLALIRVRLLQQPWIKIPSLLLLEASIRSRVIRSLSNPEKSIPSLKFLILPFEMATDCTKVPVSVIPPPVPLPVMVWPFMSIATFLWWTMMQSPAAVRFVLRKKFPAVVIVNGQDGISVSAEAAGAITPKQRPTTATRVSQRTTVFEIISLPPPLYGWQSHDRRIF